MMLSDVCLSRT